MSKYNIINLALEDDQDIDSQIAKINALEELKDKLEKTGKITRNMAMEADNLLGGDKFTTAFDDPDRRIALEELSTGMIAAIIAVIISILGWFISKLFGGSSSYSSSSDSPIYAPFPEIKPVVKTKTNSKDLFSDDKGRNEDIASIHKLYEKWANEALLKNSWVRFASSSGISDLFKALDQMSDFENNFNLVAVNFKTLYDMFTQGEYEKIIESVENNDYVKEIVINGNLSKSKCELLLGWKDYIADSNFKEKVNRESDATIKQMLQKVKSARTPYDAALTPGDYIVELSTYIEKFPLYFKDGSSIKKAIDHLGNISKLLKDFEKLQADIKSNKVAATTENTKALSYMVKILRYCQKMLRTYTDVEKTSLHITISILKLIIHHHDFACRETGMEKDSVIKAVEDKCREAIKKCEKMLSELNQQSA